MIQGMTANTTSTTTTVLTNLVTLTMYYIIHNSVLN